MEPESRWDDKEIPLPIEIVINFFKNLSGKEVYKCCRVCKFWKSAADLLIRDECHWQKLYEKDYSEIYTDARKKSPLTYEGLYKSISLWSQIKSAIVTATNFWSSSHNNTSNFQILNKDVIGIPVCQCCELAEPMDCEGCDHVAYIDLKTRKLLEGVVVRIWNHLSYIEKVTILWLRLIRILVYWLLQTNIIHPKRSFEFKQVSMFVDIYFFM